jgi:hypothetical protein
MGLAALNRSYALRPLDGNETRTHIRLSHVEALPVLANAASLTAADPLVAAGCYPAVLRSGIEQYQ